MRVIVTGGAGFVGSNVVAVAGERGDQVLFQVEPGALLNAIAQAGRVGSGGARDLAPERVGRGRDAQVGRGAGGQLAGQVGRIAQRLEGGDERVAGQVSQL